MTPPLCSVSFLQTLSLHSAIPLSPSCFTYTHAGLGSCELTAPALSKTGEYKTGIARLLAFVPETLPGELRPYLAAVLALNGGGGLRWYPGSPRLVRSLLRRQDRLVALELHPEDADRKSTRLNSSH